jgi:hypothetical protein
MRRSRKEVKMSLPVSDWIPVETKEAVVVAFIKTGPALPAEPIQGPESTEGVREGFARYRLIPGVSARARKMKGATQEYWMVEGSRGVRMAVSEQRFVEWFRVYTSE